VRRWRAAKQPHTTGCVAPCSQLRECAKADANEQTYPFIVIGLDTAMRKMEILRIRREHVDVEGRTIFIPKAKAGSRTQPMPRSLATYLECYMASLPPNVDCLFPSASSATGHTMDIRKAFRRAVRAAGLDPVKVVRHTPRHTAISQLGFTLINLPTLQKFAGHKSIATTLKYTHANAAHVQASLDKLEARYAAGAETVAPSAATSAAKQA